MTTETYANLLTRIQALAGVDAFTSTELTLLNSLINRRGYQAYSLSDLWARYIKVGQARPAPDAVISYSYDETAGVRSISSASRSGSTVTVVCSANIDGDFVTWQFVTFAGLSGSINPNGSYQVSVSGDATFTYELDTTNTGTETYSGSGTVAPDAMNDVETFIRVYLYDPKGTRSGIDASFFVDSAGCHVLSANSGTLGYWVTYRAEWEGPYDSVTNTAIPREFFDYIAHAAYADFLRYDQQNSKAIAEEQIADQYLTVQLARPQNLANALMVSKVSTHASRQFR